MDEYLNRYRYGDGCDRFYSGSGYVFKNGTGRGNGFGDGYISGFGSGDSGFFDGNGSDFNCAKIKENFIDSIRVKNNV
jgi:hypothetical protein